MDLLRLLAFANHLRLGRWNFAAKSLFLVFSQYASCLCYPAQDLLGGHSDLLRLLAFANHLRLGRWDLAATPLFLFFIIQVCVMCALSDLGLARGSFGFAPTSGLGQSPCIGSLELCCQTIVCCIVVVCAMFALSDLGIARGSFGLAPTCGSGQSH